MIQNSFLSVFIWLKLTLYNKLVLATQVEAAQRLLVVRALKQRGLVTDQQVPALWAQGEGGHRGAHLGAELGAALNLLAEQFTVLHAGLQRELVGAGG